MILYNEVNEVVKEHGGNERLALCTIIVKAESFRLRLELANQVIDEMNKKLRENVFICPDCGYKVQAEEFLAGNQ